MGDGIWSKRSYKNKYNALSGTVSAVLSAKALYFFAMK
jgi:hypothetical protein